MSVEVSRPLLILILISKPTGQKMDRRTLQYTVGTEQTFEGVSIIQMLFLVKCYSQIKLRKSYMYLFSASKT